MTTSDLMELRQAMAARHRELDTERLQRFESMVDAAAGIDRLLDDPVYRDPLERHLKTTWANRRPDLIEFLIGAVLWQRQALQVLRKSLEAEL